MVGAYQREPMVDHELPLPVFQAVVDRRCKVIVLRAETRSFRRHDLIALWEMLNGERTGQSQIVRVTWSQVTDDGRWFALSIEPAQRSTLRMGIPHPSDDVPTRPDLPALNLIEASKKT